jgi:DNA-binding GntR family transcriptional regulator
LAEAASTCEDPTAGEIEDRAVGGADVLVRGVLAVMSKERADADARDLRPGSAVLPPLDARRSLVEDAVELLRQEILSGRFRQGEHLVETKIAEQLRVSRGPVREAFKLLRAEGLVEEEPRRGTFVVSLSARDASEIYQLRAAIEGRAAQLLAASGDPARIAELSGLYAAIERAEAAKDADAVYAADLAFHDALCRLSGNARLHEVFVRYVPALRALLRLDKRVHGPLENARGVHRPLIRAIEAGDADLARKLAEQHCDDAGELIIRYLISVEDP